jgi:putative zinc ribbon protein
VADFPDLLAEWAWDVNGDLDPRRVAAGGRQRIAWRCALNPDHVWETRVADRTTKPSACPFHMSIRVHPAESLAAYFPWLAREWHPIRNDLRPDQVSRASAREVVWRCEVGHEWSAVVYARTRSRSGCPTCYRRDVSERIKAGKRHARQLRDEEAAARVDALLADRS